MSALNTSVVHHLLVDDIETGCLLEAYLSKELCLSSDCCREGAGHAKTNFGALHDRGWEVSLLFLLQRSARFPKPSLLTDMLSIGVQQLSLGI